MSSIIFDKPAPDRDEVTGMLQLIISTSRNGICVEDFTKKFKSTEAKHVGNRFLLEKKTGSIIVQFSQTGEKVEAKTVVAKDVSKMKYAVLAAKNCKDVRLSEGGLVFALEFDEKFDRDPEGRTFDNCQRFVKFQVPKPKVFYVGMFHKAERQALRFYYQ